VSIVGDFASMRDASCMGMDSRSTLRYAIDLPASMRLGTSELTSALPCRVRNISLGGVFIRGPILPIGTKVHLAFGGGPLETIEGPCTARWNTDEGTGLQFDGLRAVDTLSLSKFIRVCARMSGRIPTDAILLR
jgi:hypothetical protein